MYPSNGIDVAVAADQSRVTTSDHGLLRDSYRRRSIIRSKGWIRPAPSFGSDKELVTPLSLTFHPPTTSSF